MNIAILSDRLIQSGGTEAYLQGLINEYLQQGDTITLYTTKLDNRLNILNNKNLTVIKQNLSHFPKKLRHILYDKYLRKHLKKHSFDLIISVNAPYSPDIGICCGTYLGDLKASSWPRKINPLNHVRIVYEKKKYTESRLLVAHSSILKQELIDFYKVSPEIIKVIYPIPPLDKFKHKSLQSKEKFKKKYNLCAEKINFLFPSTGHKRKGLQIIIEAIKQIEDVNINVVVAGSGQEGFEKLESIKYLGYVENISELYHACDVTLLPSCYEPFGIVVAESLLCGSPVIISKYVGAKDLVNPAFGTVLENLNPTDLAQAMKKYAVSKDLILDNANINKTFELYVDHYVQLKQFAVPN